MEIGDSLRRKVSKSGQVRFPPALAGNADNFFAVEPGTLVPANNIHFYPAYAPPEFDGPIAGEILRIAITNGQVTLPASFRDRAGIRVGDNVKITLREDYIEVAAAEPEE